MWSFAVGLYLVMLTPNSLQLTAIYGFSAGGAILLCGALIGNWVDRYRRIKGAVLYKHLLKIFSCEFTFLFIVFLKSRIG